MTAASFCLRHDTAPMVLYFNKPLMNRFLDRAPATWQEYEALGKRVGSEHPGYVVGSFGDAWGFKAFFDASGCPSSRVLGEKRVHINFGYPPRCARGGTGRRPVGQRDSRPIRLLRPQLQRDRPSRQAPDAGRPCLDGVRPASEASRAAGTTSPADHQLAVAPPLRWEGDTQVMASTWGGGAWAISKHTGNLPLALDFIVWMVGAPQFWINTPDYPVYLPVQPAWQRAVSANPLFANDPFPAMQTASQAISPLYTLPGYDVMGTMGEFFSLSSE